MKQILWNEQFKIRISQALKSRDKHDVVKLLLVRKLIRKHNAEKQYIKIYTEFEVEEGIICDVYYENYKSKQKYAFEIQKDMSKQAIENKLKKYKRWNDMFSSTDLIIIDLNKLSMNIEEMEQQLEEYVI